MIVAIFALLMLFLIGATFFFAGGLYSLLTSWRGGDDWDELIILLLLFSFCAGSLVTTFWGLFTI